RDRRRAGSAVFRASRSRRVLRVRRARTLRGRFRGGGEPVDLANRSGLRHCSDRLGSVDGRAARAPDRTKVTVMLHRPTIALVILIAVICASYAHAQDYHGKLTVGVYRADGQSTTDLNVRYSAGDWTGWVGWYGPQSEIRQSRAGIEYDFKRPWLVLV